MGTFGGIDEIGCKHGVEGNAVESDPVSFEYNPVVLNILAYLGERWIFEDRFQQLQGFCKRYLTGNPQVAVRTGDVEGFILLDRKRNADNLRQHWVCRSRLRVHRYEPCGFESCDQCGQGLDILDGVVLFFTEIGFFGEESLQLRELKFLVKLGECRAVRFTHLEICDLKMNRGLIVQCHQLFAQHCLVFELDEVVVLLFLGNGVYLLI
jgi:hypothetical protein